MKAAGRKNVFLLMVVISIAIVPRFYRLTAPQMLDFHSWRQGDSAAFVRGYLQNNLQLLDPRVDRQPCAHVNASFGQVEGELPIPSYLTAIPLWLLGIKYPEPWTIRLASILFFIGTCIYLYAFVLRLSGERPFAVASLAVLSLSPLSIFFSRSPQPDGPALMFSAAFLYYLSCYLAENRFRDVVLATTFLSVLLLSKISNLFILLPALGLIISSLGVIGLFKRWSLWIALILALVPAIGWYYYAQRFSWSFGIWGADRGPTKWTDIAIFTNFEIWRLLNERVVFEIVGWPAIILAAIGFGAYAKNAALTLSLVWVVAVTIFIAATLPAQRTHVYYQLPLILPISVAAGYGIVNLYRRGWRGHVVLAALLVFQLLLCRHALWGDHINGFHPYFAEDTIVGEGATLARTYIKDKRFVSTDRNPSLFYNSDRQGFFADGSSLFGVLNCLERSKARCLLVDRVSERHWRGYKKGWEQFSGLMQPVVDGINYSVYCTKQ
jgi:hypothetical protein